MTDVVAKSVIAIEIDDSRVGADLTAAEAIFKSFSKRMFEAAKIRPTVDINQFGKRIVSVAVDPKTTEAGMKVIQNIVKEYSQRLSKEANIDVGVDVRKAEGKLAGLFARIKKTAIDGIGLAITQAFTFTISRNIERAILYVAKIPYKVAAAAIAAANTQTQAEMKLGKAIEATGGAAKKTTEELAKNAKALEKLTGTADTTVLAIQSILVASKGLSGTNFDRATESALDLAEVLGGDAVNKAEKLAKALQEPVKALEMLRDEGVSFTEDQQNVVKYFVKVNDLASAQSIILDALEDKYGGAARSVGLLAEKLADAGNRLDTLLENMGGAALENTEAFTDALDAGLDVLEQIAPAVTASAVVLAELATSIVGLTIGTADAEDAATSFMQKVDEWRIAFHLLGNQATITKLKIQRFLVDSTEILMGNFDLTKAIGLDAGIKALEKGMQKRAQLLAEGLQADRAARRKKQADEAAARQADADARRQEAAKRLADAKILADADIERTKKEKGEKKRLSQEKAAEDKRLKEEERTRLKAQQDFEKSMGRDSLVGLHQRIQDAMYLRREEAKKKKQVETADKVVKDKPVFAPEDPVKWGIPWVKQQEEKAKKKQEQEEQALKERDKREAMFKQNERDAIFMKAKEAQAANQAIRLKADKEKEALDNAKSQERKAGGVLDNLKKQREEMPPLSSATPPSKRKRSFAPEGGTPSFAPESSDIKVTVKPEQKEVVSSITAQTRALSKAITESRKLT